MVAASAAEAWSARGNIRPPLAAFPLLIYAGELAIVFAAYFLAGKAGLAVPFTSGNVSPLWPPAGIAVAALLLLGTRVWPAIAAGAFLVNFLSPIPLHAALALAAGNTAGPVFGWWLLRRLPGFSSSLGQLDDVLSLAFLAAPATAAITASAGVTVLFVTGVDPWSAVEAAWLVWWLGDVLGVLLIAPLALTLGRQARNTPLSRVPELLLLLAATTLTGLVIFDSRMGGSDGDVLVFALLPLVLWGALRFEVSGAAGVTFLVACIALWDTRSGLGPFVRNSTLQNATMLQGFIAVIAASGLTLAAVIAERAHLARREARREGLAEGERRYHGIVETANDGIWMLDARLMTVFVNPRMAEMLGYTVEEMTGTPLSEYVANAAWDERLSDLHQPCATAPERFETQYRKKDGSEIQVTVSRTRALAEDGTFTGVLKMVCDDTAQRRAEREREQARNQLTLLSKAVEQTADSVLISDRNGCIEYVNPAFEETTGFTRAEAIGRTPRILKSGLQEQEFYTKMWTRLLAGEPYRGALVNRKKSGELYWANQTITAIKDSSGAITHFVSVLKDVTEIRKYHAQEVRLRLAQAVQQRFYPPSPHRPGFDIAAASYPANETGGDYFDFVDAPDQGLYIAIGDVSGHGFDAALIMALTRAYMRSFLTLGMDVGEVLARVNRAIIGDLEPERYVTMLLVRIDGQARRMTYASAGHVPGVLLQCAGERDCPLPSTGFPLGLFPDAEFPARAFQFTPQQILVLVTDGAEETIVGGEREFTRDRVMEYVRAHASDSAQQIATGVYDAARAFGEGEDQRDDITTVIVKVTD